MSITNDDRRLRRYLVNYYDVLDWFVMASGGFPKFLRVPVCLVPEGSKVLAVHDEPLNRCFAFTVQHPSFLVVADGDVIPTEVVAWRYQEVEIVDFEADDSVTVVTGSNESV